MSWVDESLDRLGSSEGCGYQAAGPAFGEPTALAALTLLAHRRPDTAAAHLRWLAACQLTDGGVGLNPTQAIPCWPTSLAILAWATAQATSGMPPEAVPYQSEIGRAAHRALELAGRPVPQLQIMGHNTSLIGWPWVEGTHSWSEPTAMMVLALKSVGYRSHARTREGVQLLIDRLLPEGGCNYGNTFVLGQELRPHLEPTGAALLALRGESDTSGRIDRTVDYLEQAVNERTTSVSLSYGLMGLAAFERVPAAADDWLGAAHGRTMRRGGSPYELALLTLAAARERSPLIWLPKGRKQPA